MVFTIGKIICEMWNSEVVNRAHIDLWNIFNSQTGMFPKHYSLNDKDTDVLMIQSYLETSQQVITTSTIIQMRDSFV